MNRLAVFVEGYTEILFVEKLINQIAGINNVIVESTRIQGGGRSPRMMVTLQAAREATNEKYYVLLVDCGGDHQVAARIREEHQNLTNAGYLKIIGLRDVRPNFSFDEIAELQAGLSKHIDGSLIPVQFILAVMEIEAWFLAEYHHYEKISPAITLSAIKAALNFDPSIDDMAKRDTPTVDLGNIYQIGGEQYGKPGTATIEALDYSYIYVELRNKIPQLKAMLESIDEFLV